MKNVLLTPARINDELDQYSADLAISVYQFALRATTPRSWLDLELGLWQAISNILATQDANGH